MFAYAIWDAPPAPLFLARDRFGKKPLYYAVLPQGLYFGSELKCLRVAGVPAGNRRRSAAALLSVHLYPRSAELLSRRPQASAGLLADL